MVLGRRGRDSVSSNHNTGLMTFLCANWEISKFHKITHEGVLTATGENT